LYEVIHLALCKCLHCVSKFIMALFYIFCCHCACVFEMKFSNYFRLKIKMGRGMCKRFQLMWWFRMVVQLCFMFGANAERKMLKFPKINFPTLSRQCKASMWATPFISHHPMYCYKEPNPTVQKVLVTINMICRKIKQTI
jgi:hypothetical protein